jgi:hypothetical protein
LISVTPELFNRISTAVGPLQGIVAVLFLSVLLGVARPAMTALPTGTIEVVVKNAPRPAAGAGAADFARGDRPDGNEPARWR